MQLDIVNILTALESHDIRVARTAKMDSAEAAVAFAERRTAHDPRFHPIVLRYDTPGATGSAASVLHDEAAIRDEYARLTAPLEHPVVLAQNAPDPGTDLTVIGSTNESGERSIAIDGSERRLQRLVPLGEGGAAALAAHARAFEHHGTEREQHMLEHVLLRLSDFFEGSGISAFRLSVRLHDNGYTVIDGSGAGPALLQPRKRADHDRKAVGYRPAGRQ